MPGTIPNKSNRRLLVFCDYGPGLIDAFCGTLNQIELSCLVLVRKRGNAKWRGAKTHVINLPLRVFNEEEPLSVSAILSLVAYLVMATLVGVIEVAKHRINTILAVFAFPQGLVAVVVGRLTGGRTAILTDGGDLDVFLRKPSVRALMLACMRGANAVTALNRTKAARLLSFGIKAQINPTIGVDISRFEYTPFAEKQERLVLYVGRLVKEKRPELFLRACKRLIQQGVGLRVLLVGDGPLSSRIAEMARKEMRDVATIARFISHSDMHQLFRKCAIFVLPSAREGVSVSLLEAMSSGCICIVSDIPDNRELIQDLYNGVVFKVDNEQDLADRLRWVMSQHPPVLAPITARARLAVETGYSMQVVAKALAVLLSRLSE